MGVAELYGTLNSQLDYFTVEKLLKDFVEAKGTGRDKPSKPPLTWGPGFAVKAYEIFWME